MKVHVGTTKHLKKIQRPEEQCVSTCKHVKCNEQNLSTNNYAHVRYFKAKRPSDDISINLTEDYETRNNGHKFALTAIYQLSGSVYQALDQAKQLILLPMFLELLVSTFFHPK